MSRSLRGSKYLVHEIGNFNPQTPTCKRASIIKYIIQAILHVASSDTINVADCLSLLENNVLLSKFPLIIRNT